MSDSPTLRPVTLDVRKIAEVSAKDGIVTATLQVSLLELAFARWDSCSESAWFDFQYAVVEARAQLHWDF